VEGKMNKLRSLNLDEVGKLAPGVNPDVAVKLIDLINDETKDRAVPLYIFINPNFRSYADQLGTDVSTIFNAFKFFSFFFAEKVKFSRVLIQDDLFYVLQEEDVEELENDNTIHNPNDPRNIISNAKDFVRLAFKIG
jgi:hypothetical protein